MTLNTISRNDFVLFSTASVWRFILPLPFTMTAFGTKLLRASVVSLGWVKHFRTKMTGSFLKGEMYSSFKSVMMFPMFFMGGQMQIFKSVIGFVFIDMVDYFVRSKSSTKIFSHNISVFKRLRSTIKHKIIGSIHQYVSCPMNRFSAIPIMVVFAGINCLRNSVRSFNDLSHVMIIGQIYHEVKP